MKKRNYYRLQKVKKTVFKKVGKGNEKKHFEQTFQVLRDEFKKKRKEKI